MLQNRAHFEGTVISEWQDMGCEKKQRREMREKIGVWYNTTYGRSVKKKKTVSFRKIFNKPELDPPAPVKTCILHYYSRHFYKEHIKSCFATRWATASRLPEPPAIVTLRNQVTKEQWDAEPEEFKAEVIAAREAEHKRAMDVYAMAVSGEVPTMPEEYNVALNNAAYYLQPFADSVHEHFGMNVVILLCGPVPERGGRIEVRSVHSGKSNGMVPRIWPDFDRTGFDTMQRSFVEFSHHCFTESECRARSLNEMAMAEKDLLLSSEGEQSTADAVSPPEPSAIEGLASAALPSTAPTSVDASVLEQCVQIVPFDPLQVDLDSLLSLLKGVGPNGEGDLELDLYGGGDLGLDLFGLPILLPPSEDEEEDDRPQLNVRNMDEEDIELPAVSATQAPATTRPKPKPAYRGQGAMGNAETPPFERPEVNPEVEGPVQPVQSLLNQLEVSREVERPVQLVDEAPPRSSTEDTHLPEKEVVQNARSQDLPQKEVEDTEREGGTMWEEQDIEGWPHKLRKVFGEFVRAKSWGGEKWADCLTQLITLERVWQFPNKGLLAAPKGGERPSEIAKFMQYGRKWGVTLELQSAVGPREEEGLFASRWWDWWDAVQPKGRKSAKGKLGRADKMAVRNGVLLYVGALLWWGEAAAAEPEAEMLLKEWRGAVDDVRAVLAQAVAKAKGKQGKAQSTSKAAAPRTSKHKKADSASNADKENQPLRGAGFVQPVLYR
ncbi:hypothetical protein B0H19DRAFT_1070382 [Mycena capillaripes]|nr:hypothetical protein B0H19DRAFT_1070382 [Mycena capillaripes]